MPILACAIHADEGALRSGVEVATTIKSISFGSSPAEAMAFRPARAARSDVQRQGAAAPRESVPANGFGHRPHESPKLNLDHLYHMTDSTGILQHASFTAPNLSEGYCTDDNARALILAVL